MTNKTLAERFFEKVHINTESGCWEWTAKKNKQGYGEIRVNYKHTRAHRVSFEMFNGPIDGGNVVCHTCDNPSCVNPHHLFQGTQSDNMQDMVRKGRQAKHVKKGNNAGSTNGQALLTEPDVALIKAFCKRVKTYGCRAFIANWFGVSLHTVWLITKGKTWSHVK